MHQAFGSTGDETEMETGNVWAVRQATPADENRLKRLIAQAERVMVRFHEDNVRHYLSQEPFLVAERDGRLRGFLAFFVRQPPRAALAAAGLADDWAVAPWLDRLLPRCVAHLQALGVTSLSYIGTADWLAGPLQERAFRLVSHIVTYEKSNCAIPYAGNQTVQVRPVRPTDFAALVALDKLAFHPLWRNSVVTLRRWQEVSSHFVVAVVEEEPIGYCYCSMEEKHGHLIRVAVHPAWQGRGVGTRLLAEAMRFFRRAGARLITLNTQAENKRAQRLYRQFGFRLMGREAVALWRDLRA